MSKVRLDGQDGHALPFDWTVDVRSRMDGTLELVRVIDVDGRSFALEEALVRAEALATSSRKPRMPPSAL